ncbi:stealth family protein [Legionella feeleii]|uniref:Capsular polysaccharide phosphotransferase SacB n=1 Tax=Legionella feeleii TaxID=453 RepID=A0A378IP95_9GAMM|nr:stealth family protein [Legionella feeleii]STX36863.1 Capsular polysaccharide phosphotransferase SacB [Legionella feeleii]
MMQFSYSPPTESIDAVITWVDGDDPAYQEKLAYYLSQTTLVHPEATAKTRFCQAGELEYCVTSLFRFAPWLRNIYIVTDNQIPPLLDKLAGTSYENKVHLIDHKVIFSGFEHFLPTFNSLTIETLLWRIPGLSERFLYLNDDFVLVNPVSPTNFFRNNHVVLRGKWRKFRSQKLSHRILDRMRAFRKRPLSNEPEFPKHRLAQENSARLTGHDKDYFYLYHNPHSLHRSTLANYFAVNCSQLTTNLCFRFRAAEQFVMTTLAAHLEIKAKKVVIDNQLHCLQLKLEIESLRNIKQLIRCADRNKNLSFVCVQSLDSAPLAVRDVIFTWLDRRIGSFDYLLAEKQRIAGTV